jgi:hypothetical protein
MYKLDRTLNSLNTKDISYLTPHKHFHGKYLDVSLFKSLNDLFIQSCDKRNIHLHRSKLIKIYARYFRGLKTLHLVSNTRGGNAIRY